MKMKKIISIFIFLNIYLLIFILQCFAATGFTTTWGNGANSHYFDYGITRDWSSICWYDSTANDYFLINYYKGPLSKAFWVKGDGITRIHDSYLSNSPTYLAEINKIYFVLKSFDGSMYYSALWENETMNYNGFYVYSGSGNVRIGNGNVCIPCESDNIKRIQYQVPTGSYADKTFTYYSDFSINSYPITGFSAVHNINEFNFSPANNSQIQLVKTISGNANAEVTFMVEGWLKDFIPSSNPIYSFSNIFPNDDPNNPFLIGVSVKGENPLFDVVNKVYFDDKNSNNIAEHVNGAFHFKSYWKLILTQNSKVTILIQKRATGFNLLNEDIYKNEDINYIALPATNIIGDPAKGNILAPPSNPNIENNINWGKIPDYSNVSLDSNFFMSGMSFVTQIFGIFPAAINALILITMGGLVAIGVLRAVLH